MGRIAVAFAVLVAGCSFEPGSFDEPGTADEEPAGEQPDASVATAATCPASYTLTLAGSSSRYRVVNTEAPWPEAVAACAADQSAAFVPHLVVLSDDAEREALLPMVASEIWVGLSNRRTSDGSFQWVTTERAAPLPRMAPWEPDDPDLDEVGCADLDGESGLLSDDECESERAYVCECDQFANDPSRN
jgi:hypothetical protein